MRRLVLLLTAPCLLLPAAARSGEKKTKPPAKKPGEVRAGLQAMGRLPFITPKEARREFARVTVAGGKGSLPIAGLGVKFERGRMAVVAADGKNKAPLAVGVPLKGFSQAIAAEVSHGDGSKGQVAVSFARTGKAGEYFARNTVVAIAQYGDSTVTVVDDNCNGRYNDAGEDAVMVGRGTLAAPLGSLVLIGGVPHSFQVSESGKSMTFTPVKGSKLGFAKVSRKYGHLLLIGAVLKGPGGAFHVIGDRRPTLLPVGSYSLAFASLGNPAAGQFAILEGGGANVKVTADRKIGLLKFGRPKLAVKASYDARNKRVRIEGPKADDISCLAGKLKLFYVPGAPRVNIIRIGRTAEHKQARNIKMSMSGKVAAPRGLNLGLRKYNLDKGKKYRFEVRWPNGVIDEATGSVTLKIPRSSAAAKKK